MKPFNGSAGVVGVDARGPSALRQRLPLAAMFVNEASALGKVAV